MKIYLHGGRSSFESNENRSFRQKLASEIRANSNMLMCYFASEESNWNDFFNKDSELFLREFPELQMTLAKRDTFEEQVSNTSLLFLSGGDSFLLIESLKAYPNFPSFIRDKVVVGVSAGACALSKYFYSNDEKRVAEGLGILNVKVYCHYKPELDANVEELKSFKEELPIITLPEHHSVIIF